MKGSGKVVCGMYLIMYICRITHL